MRGCLPNLDRAPTIQPLCCQSSLMQPAMILYSVGCVCLKTFCGVVGDVVSYVVWHCVAWYGLSYGALLLRWFSVWFGCTLGILPLASRIMWRSPSPYPNLPSSPFKLIDYPSIDCQPVILSYWCKKCIVRSVFKILTFLKETAPLNKLNH